MTPLELFELILEKRGIRDIEAFSRPDYKALGDPFLLPDMEIAVRRISDALHSGEEIAVYGDYDIDGLTATTVLKEALQAFGADIDAFIPDRFVDGYGMSRRGIDVLANKGVTLLITVDTGSLSHEHIDYAKTKGVDVIVTDHHTTSATLPRAIAVINPKRTDSSYPFRELAGVGVAFTLVRGLQQWFAKKHPTAARLEDGQEKWLLDLVSLGTVCDIVPLLDENRTLVYWGLEVMKKTKRPGLKALAESSRVAMDTVSPTDYGFRFGPRLNASGRLVTAADSLALLSSKSLTEAHALASQLEAYNQERRALQDRITEEAEQLAQEYADDSVLVLGKEGWSHGVVGIVAAKLTERLTRPTFVLELEGETAKGSARSFGDFRLDHAIESLRDLVQKGGGHAYAAGVTLPSSRVNDFRTAINSYYAALGLHDQHKYLQPDVDVHLQSLKPINMELMGLLDQLAPFGNQHDPPRFGFMGHVQQWRSVGADGRHAKATIVDEEGTTLDAIGFGLAERMPKSSGPVNIIFQPEINEFRGRKSVQMHLLHVAHIN